MKFSEKMCLKITLKNQGFAFSVEDAFFGKPEPPLPTPPHPPPPSTTLSSISRFRVKLIFLDSSPPPGFPKNVYGVGSWGIISEDNPAGHCFVLRNLVPASFFTIVLLKMHV